MSIKMVKTPGYYKIVNALLWSSKEPPRLVSLDIQNGVVSSIHDQDSTVSPGSDDVDALGKALLPLGVDLQVHTRVPGQLEKESPESSLRSALRGGVGAVLTMPNTKPVLDSAEALTMGQKEFGELESQFGVKVLFSAAITKGQAGQELCDFEELKKAGAVALTDDGVGVLSDALMLQAFERAVACELPILQHAEMPGHGAALAPGPLQKKLGLVAYPAEAEWKMVQRDVALLRKVPKARYHILHISSRKTLQILKEAKEEGLSITGEATPHHLWFNSSVIGEGQTDFKMNPPIRDEEDRVALVEALSSGLVDFMSTDHAPHEKARKGPDFRVAAFGTTGLETSLRVLIGLWRQGHLNSQRLVEVWCTKPSRFIGQIHEFNDISMGAPLRAVWVDVEAAPQKVEVSDLESQSKNNCFLGHSLPGKILGIFHKDRLFRF